MNRRTEDPVQVVLAGTQVTSGTHATVYNRLVDISRRRARAISTASLVVWRSRRAADTSTNRRQGFLCRRTASMEQAADRAEAAAIEHQFSSSTKQLCSSQPADTGIHTDDCFVMRQLGLPVAAAIQIGLTQLQTYSCSYKRSVTLFNV